jgi:hypothetical protein
MFTEWTPMFPEAEVLVDPFNSGAVLFVEDAEQVFNVP